MDTENQKFFDTACRKIPRLLKEHAGFQQIPTLETT